MQIKPLDLKEELYGCWDTEIVDVGVCRFAVVEYAQIMPTGFGRNGLLYSYHQTGVQHERY